MTPRTGSTRETIDWLRLARTESIGAVTFAQLIARYGSATEALNLLPDLARRSGRAQAFDLASVAEAEAELCAGEALGARLLKANHPDYPHLLSVLDPPPPVIWALGKESLVRRRAVAIVGARAASAAGRRFAHTLAAALGEAGYCVVSGMARGIDAAAHDGSLASGSIAVLAGGVDDVYPAENAGLYDALRTSGCVVSERPPGFKARAADFPRRNRLISGLALGVVVVEAELRSGSLITARLAGEQGRDVFAVPGFPTDPRARGANDLIRNGAVLVETVADILQVLGEPNVTVTSAAPPPAPGGSDEDEFTSNLLGLLSPSPTAVDDLARMTGRPISRVLAAVTELALAGRLEILPGGAVVLISSHSR